MPAPVRPNIQFKPISQASVIVQEESEQPLIISPVSSNSQGDFLSRFTEVIMFGGAMLAIWTGLLGIAFSDDATNYNYLILFVGGFLSAGIAIAMVEFHGKKNSFELMPSQNYLLGLSFFFMAIGLLWGVRFIAGWLTYDSPFNEFDVFGPAIADEDLWVPNANMIYAQTFGAIILVLGQQRLLKRYSGELTFAWTVSSCIPLGLLLVGVGPWIDYSNNVISYELGIAIVSLSAISMITAINSNKSITFTIIASVCGIIPLVYELLNTNAPDDGIGGSISLIVFIIIIQGYLATNPKINQKLMEKTSFILIGEIVLTMLVASSIDANAILGPLRMSDTVFASTLTLPVIIWFVTLAAFFPAVLSNRVPAMPIGLAFALWTLNGDEAILPWVTAIIMITYMIFFAKVTRLWVANATISAISVSYLLSDIIGYGIDDQLINLTIALSIIAISWLGIRLDKISFYNGIQAVVFILFSSTILDSPYWFTTWIIVLFLITMVFERMKNVSEDDFNERRNVTLALITSLSFASVMMITDKMAIPYEIDVLNGAMIEFIVFGLFTHFLFFTTRKIEMDLGEFLWVLKDKSDSKWTFDNVLNVWVLKDEDSETNPVVKWGEISRFSLAFAIFSVCIGLSTIEIENTQYQYFLPLLLALPISLLLHQLSKLEEISSNTRFVGVLHLIIIAMFTKPLLDFVTEDSGSNSALIAGIIHDLILISTPFYVNYVISKRGLDENLLNRLSDNLMFAGLLFLASFDQSGGLMFFSLFGLVAVQSLKYRMGIVNFAPIVFLFTADFDTFSASYGISYQFIEMITSNPDSYFTEKVLWFTRFTGMITSIYMMFVLAVSFTDSKKKDLEHRMSWIAPMIWFFFAALAALPDAAWLPLIIVSSGVVNAWYRGETKWMSPLSVGLIISWLIGYSDGLADLDGQIFGISMLSGGLTVAGLSILNSGKVLTKHVEDYGQLTEAELIEKINAELKFLSLIPLMLSFDVFFGIGMLIASIWATVEVFRVGDKTSLLALPLLHAFTLGNQLAQLEISSEEGRAYGVGLLLVLEGIALLYLSSKDDIIYDAKMFTWRDDDEFFSYVERMGLAGAISAIAGVGYAFNSNLQLAFLILTLILTGIAISGFNEKYQNIRWRRALGVYGSMISGLCFYGEVDNDLYGNLTIVGLGLLALGYGFIYLQQRSSIVVDETPIQSAILTIPEPIREKEDLDDNMEEQAQDETEEDAAIDVDEEIVEPSEIEDEEIEEAIEDEVAVEDSEPVEEIKPTITTDSGLDIRFPPGVLDTITKTIELTPHEGYNPVLEISENGKLKLVFDPSN